VEGEVWHTQFDTLAYLDKTFSGRANAHLELFTRVLYAVLTDYRQP
jgi:hypothetical protein